MNSTPDSNRVAIVTGGSRGIGRAVVARLARDGFDIVINYAGNRDEAQAAADEVTAAGRRALVAQADVADEDAVAAMFDTAEAALGGVDAVIHAAGRLSLAPLAELDLGDLDALLRTNVRGTFVVAQQAVRRLREGGSLVTFSSSVVGLHPPAYGAYTASKGAVEALTMIAAKEVRGRDITVNAVAPGPTATALFLDGKDQAEIDRLAAAPPLERLGRPEDIAGVVSFLVGPDGHWVNGQVLRANGGIA